MRNIALSMHLENNRDKLKAVNVRVSELVWSLDPIDKIKFDYILISDW